MQTVIKVELGSFLCHKIIVHGIV